MLCYLFQGRSVGKVKIGKTEDGPTLSPSATHSRLLHTQSEPQTTHSNKAVKNKRPPPFYRPAFMTPDAFAALIHGGPRHHKKQINYGSLFNNPLGLQGGKDNEQRSKYNMLTEDEIMPHQAPKTSIEEAAEEYLTDTELMSKTTREKAAGEVQAEEPNSQKSQLLAGIQRDLQSNTIKHKGQLVPKKQALSHARKVILDRFGRSVRARLPNRCACNNANQGDSSEMQLDGIESEGGDDLNSNGESMIDRLKQRRRRLGVTNTKSDAEMCDCPKLKRVVAKQPQHSQRVLKNKFKKSKLFGFFSTKQWMRLAAMRKSGYRIPPLVISTHDYCFFG